MGGKFQSGPGSCAYASDPSVHAVINIAKPSREHVVCKLPRICKGDATVG